MTQQTTTLLPPGIGFGKDSSGQAWSRHGRGRSRAWSEDPDNSPVRLPACVPSGAYELLSAVLSQTPRDDLKVIQCMPFADERYARLVAEALAAASASAFGRTLLLDVTGLASPGGPACLGETAANAEPIALRRAMTPDMARPGLHYAGSRAVNAADLRDLVAKIVRSTDAQPSPFRMVVLDETRALLRAQRVMLAGACTAVIPVAVAGASRLPEMRETLARLRAGGATILGLVMVHPRGTGG